MAYTIHQFMARFPTDDICLDFILKQRFAGRFTRIKGKKAYRSSNGKRVYPLKGTIFERSHTPLTKWFYAIYLFANSKNSVSAKELQRHIGVPYQTAWRMCYMIRTLMKQDPIKLSGVVEADETYIGGTRRLDSWKKKKVPVAGMVARDGQVILKVLPSKDEYAVIPFVKKHLHKGSTLYTDSAPVYNSLQGFKRGRVVHTQKEYVRGDVHTNSIEGVWSKVKGSIKGTHRSVSRKYLQTYLDPQAFHHNNRGKDILALMLEKI